VQAVPGGEEKAKEEWDQEFTHYLPVMAEDDFLGVQNYSRTIIGPDGSLPVPEGKEKTQMDYEYYPEGIAHVLRRVAKDFHGDLIVTENGIATADDSRRVEFIRRALQGIDNCVSDGIPVKGYCHWSLMDNFEWQKGFSMTFGLIGVNRETMERIPKPSLSFLGGYAR
jgi:beta-glucosidase